MTVLARIKLGEAVNITLGLAQDDGTPIDITGATLFSEVRDICGNLVATPELSVTNAELGVVSYQVMSDANWPVGRVITDVAISFGGIPFLTDTGFIEVVQPVTQWQDQNVA